MLLTSLADEVLEIILKYGYIEDIVAKERVSTRFRNLSNRVVSKRTRFSTRIIVNSKNVNSILGVIPKMSSLTDISSLNSFYEFTDAQIKTLATANQQLKHFHSDSHSVLLYIKYVKEIDPSYDASNITCSFFPDTQGYNHLRSKYPDLDIKFRTRGNTINQYGNSDMCGRLSLWEPEDKLDGRKSYPSVREVETGSEYEHLTDLALLPSLEYITLYCGNSSTTNLRHICLHLSSNLHHFDIRSNGKWNEEDNSPLEFMIHNFPLKRLHITFPTNFPVEKVIQMVIDSPIRTLKELILPNFELRGKEMICSSSYSGEADCMSIRLCDTFRNIELLYPLLKRFHRVALVRISTFALKQVDIHRIFDIFQLILSSDHRRKFNLEISPGSTYYF